jgi:integrase
VSKRLGHSSVNVTASNYSHAFAQDELAAAEIWDDVMWRATQATRPRQ